MCDYLFASVLSCLAAPAYANDSPPAIQSPPAIRAEYTAADACVRIDLGNAGGSGTCVWSEGGFSVVLTAEHVATRQEHGYVTHAGNRYPAHRYGTNAQHDLGLFWVEGSLPVAVVADAEPAVNTEVRMYGRTTTAARGRVTGTFATTSAPWTTANYPSYLGDSGAGVFDLSGQLVGVHLGRFTDVAGRPAQIAPVSLVRVFVRETAGPQFPRLRALFSRPTKATVSVAPKAEPPAVKTPTAPAPKAVVPPTVSVTFPAASNCPGGVCPSPGVGVRTRGLIFRR